MSLLRRLKNLWYLSGQFPNSDPKRIPAFMDKYFRPKGLVIEPKSEEVRWMEEMFEANDTKGQDTEIGKIEIEEV